MEARPWLMLKWVVGALLVIAAVSTTKAGEKGWSRAYRSELYPIIQVLGGNEITSLKGTVKLKTEAIPVLGAGMGVNFSDYLNLNTELLVGRMDTVESLTVVPGTDVSLGLTTWLWNANLDYNFCKSRLTPLVTGGLGFIKFHNDGENTDEVYFSYNLGLGGRWDITDRIALRVIYRLTWTQIEEADDPFQFDCVAANLIFMFK